MLLNRQRALALMQAAGLDALVAASPVNVTYLTDYACWIDPLFKGYMMRPGGPVSIGQHYGVLFADGSGALVVASTWIGNAADCWVDELRTFGPVADLDFSLTPATLPPAADRLRRAVQAGAAHASASAALAALLRERGVAAGRIGVELEGLTAEARAELLPALAAARVLDCANLIRLVRMIKTGEEIERLERSASIAYSASRAALAEARPGVRLRDLRDRYVERLAAEGATLDHFIYSPAGLGIWQEPEYTLRDGDTLYVDIGCVYQHYLSDLGTTLLIGSPDPELATRLEAVHAALARGVELLRPGVHASAVRDGMIRSLAGDGITGSNAHGHGVGLEVRDYPIIVAATGLPIRDDCVDVPSDLPLEADMVVNLEVPLFLFGRGSLHVEQTFHITPGGPRRLDSTEPTAAVRAG